MKEEKMLQEAKLILAALGLPKQQQNRISCLTLIALCRLPYSSSWDNAKAESLTLSKGIMTHVVDVLNAKYAQNSRENFRRKVLHQLVQAGLALYNPDNPHLPTNSQDYHYRISPEALEAIKKYGTSDWEALKQSFLAKKGSLILKHSSERQLARVPVTLPDGRVVSLSPGEHNRVQAAIIDEFASRFAASSVVLYLADTEKKALIFEAAQMEALGIPLNQHGKMPDVVLYDPKKNWLFLVEAVTSHGPMSPKRLAELKEMLKGCSAGFVFVSAFLSLKDFKKYATQIAWDTEVWLVDTPDHMLHLNGDRFLGPR